MVLAVASVRTVVAAAMAVVVATVVAAVVVVAVVVEEQEEEEKEGEEGTVVDSEFVTRPKEEGCTRRGSATALSPLAALWVSLVGNRKRQASGCCRLVACLRIAESAAAVVVVVVVVVALIMATTGGARPR